MKTLKELYQNDVPEFPTRKWEAWKYVHLEPLLNSKFEEGEFLIQTNFADPKEILRSSQDDRPAEEPNPFVRVNAARFKKETVVYLARDNKQPQPLYLSLKKNSASSIAGCPRVRLQAEAGASADVIFQIPSGISKEAFLNLVIEARLEPSSKINLILVEEEEASTARFVSCRFFLTQGSELNFVTYSEGGVLDRNDVVADFGAAGAAFHLADLLVLKGDSRAYHHAVVAHRAGGSKSRQLFKTILGGQSQAEINSLSFVHRNAAGSDSHQLNRNLLLSDQARVWSRPQLKIYTDDVAAAHGSATGRLDASEVFYLQSRGLSPEAARTLLMFGFADEVLTKIPDRTLCETLEARVRDRIGLLSK